MSRTIPRPFALQSMAVLGVIGFMIGRISATPHLTNGEELQKVNNQVALKHIDERLATMNGPAKYQYLALQACATEISMLGVYGKVGDNPLMQRWNGLNDRYNALYKQLGAALPLPDNLTAAEDTLCKGEHPL